MSFWRLEKANLHETAYLIPHILSFSSKKSHWEYVLEHSNAKQRKAIQIFSVVFCVALLYSCILVGIVAIMVAASNTEHHVKSDVMLTIMDVCLLYIVIRIAQSCARLRHVIKHGPPQ